MKYVIVIGAALISGCSMTPTQQKWAAVGVSVVATGLIVAHQQDSGKPLTESAQGKQSCYPGNPCIGGK
jgi:hypothetical protein